MVLNQVVPAVTFNGHPHKATAICCYLYTHQKALFLLGLVIFFLFLVKLGLIWWSLCSPKSTGLVESLVSTTRVIQLKAAFQL